MGGTPIYHQLITFRLVLTARLATGIVKVVRNKKSKIFSHRYLIEFYETNRMSDVPTCTMSLTY